MSDNIKELAQQFMHTKNAYTVVSDDTKYPVPNNYGDVLVGVYYDGFEIGDTVGILFADYTPDFFLTNVHYPTLQHQFETTRHGFFMPLGNTVLELYRMPHQHVTISIMCKDPSMFYYIFQPRTNSPPRTAEWKYSNEFIHKVGK